MAATINEENNGTTVQNAQATTNQNPQTQTVQSNETPLSRKESIMNLLVKIWQNITVEPLMICWLVPTCFLVVLNENLTLEKSCRVDYGYDDIVCDNMIDKSILDINCVTLSEKIETLPNVTENIYKEISQFLSGTFTKDSVIETFGPDTEIILNMTKLEVDVCQAEIDSQKLETSYTLYTAPFDVIFGILMILFAGGWSDRIGRRKPCMLIPMTGDLAALIALLVSVIFFKQLPLWFSSILGKLLPAVTGGANLMLMGVYSYLSETSTEENRTFRFGIFAQVIPLIPLFSVPWSGYLFTTLGYFYLLVLCIIINGLGVLYIIFILEEVKHEPKIENESVELQKTGVDNPAFVNETQTNVQESQNTNTEAPASATPEKKRNFIADFFDPIVAVQCYQFVMKKRKNQGQSFLIFLFIMYFLAIGTGFGEDTNEYIFGRIRLNWAGEEYSAFTTYGIFISLVGTMVMLSVLNKWLKFTDPALGFIGTSVSAFSRLIYCTATTTGMMYVARTFDAFISIRALVIKSALSKLVAADELGKLFSITGIVEAIAKFVFVSSYSLIYQNTLNTWPAAFYFVSFIFLVITAILFAFLYYIVKRRDRKEADQKPDANTTENNKTDLGEITHM